jgi:hypothetical protein
MVPTKRLELPGIVGGKKIGPNALIRFGYNAGDVFPGNAFVR